MDYSVSKDDYFISTDKSRIDIEYVHGFLTTSYWTPGISLEKVKKGIDGSLCFSIFHGNQQIGFARMITDQASFAYLCDVFIDEKYQRKGLGTWFLEMILEHPGLKEPRRIMLATKDPHKLYEKVGFVPLNNPERYMVYSPLTNKTK